MTEPKFTPGPWWPWFTDDYGYIFSGERRDAHMIAEVRGGGWIQYLPDPEQIQEANAHLIAAAPELYEALKEITRIADQQLWSMPGWDRTGGPSDKAKAALAKARGESHD